MPENKKPKTGFVRKSKKTATPALRLFWLIYNVALEPDVKELLDTNKIVGYSAWPEVHGAGNSGPHLNDDIWPGVNAMAMFAAPAAVEAQVVASVQKIRRQFPGEGIKLIVQPCEGIF